MSDAGVNIKIKTEAELAALQQLEASLSKQIAVARALGKDYSGLADDLGKVQKALAAIPRPPDIAPPAQASAGWRGLLDQVKQLAPGFLTVAGAVMAVRQAASSGWNFLSGGIDLNTRTEDAKNGLASLMGVFNDQAPENFSARLKLADQTLDSLQKKGQMAEGTLQELQAALLQSSGRLFGAGVRDLEKQVDLVVAASLVMKQMGGSQAEVGPSLGALLSGTFNEQNKLAAGMDLPRDEIRKLARDGKLVEEVLRQWAPIVKDAEGAMGSLSSQQTIFTENVQKLQQLIASGVFEQLKGVLEGINAELASEGATNWATDLRDALEGAAIAAQKIAGAGQPAGGGRGVLGRSLDAASLLMPGTVGQTRAMWDMFRRRGARANAEREAAAEAAATDTARKAQEPLPPGTVFGVSAEDEAIGRANAERRRGVELQLQLREAVAAGNEDEARRLELVLAYRKALQEAEDAGFADKYAIAQRAMDAVGAEQAHRDKEKADKEAAAAAEKDAKGKADEAVSAAARDLKFADADLQGEMATARPGKEARKLQWLRNYKSGLSDLTEGLEPGTEAWEQAARAAEKLADNLAKATSAQQKLNESASAESGDDTGGEAGRIAARKARDFARADRFEQQGAFGAAERLRKRAERRAEADAGDAVTRRSLGGRPGVMDTRSTTELVEALAKAKMDASAAALKDSAQALQDAATALKDVGRWQ